MTFPVGKERKGNMSGDKQNKEKELEKKLNEEKIQTNLQTNAPYVYQLIMRNRKNKYPIK